LKVTFPHMGLLALVAKPALEGFGLDVIVPPPISKRTLNLGAMHAPESACLPLKVNLGNYMEAAAMGADTIIMVGGVGPCRIGYYAQVQKEILSDLGYRMNMVVLEPPDAHFREVWDRIRSMAKKPWRDCIGGLILGWHKSCAADRLEALVHRVRPRELQPGRADRIWQEAIAAIDEATNRWQVVSVEKHYRQLLQDISVDTTRPVVRVAVVGEIYTVLEPVVNLHLEQQLGRIGAEVVRTMCISQWINDHLLGGLMRVNSTKQATKAAKPYINYFIGGHGRETVGETVRSAQNGVDGVIQVAPLTCMPEIVAQSVLPVVTRDWGIPTMTIYVDEQTGEAGVTTRLEAFVDMLYRRREGRPS